MKGVNARYAVCGFGLLLFAIALGVLGSRDFGFVCGGLGLLLTVLSAFAGESARGADEPEKPDEKQNDNKK